MDQLETFKAVAAAYRQIYTKYRRDDEVEVGTSNHHRLRAILEGICVSFGRPLKVLDVGCGTGRYFHCLKNVNYLVGFDLSPEMLHSAENPVLKEQIQAETIDLHCGNIYEAKFQPASFDFIYSLGMFGFGCPVTVELCDQFHNWLAPGGILFFNAVDYRSLRFRDRVRRSLRAVALAGMPRKIRADYESKPGKIPFCGIRQSELNQLLKRSRFPEFTIGRSPCRSPLWNRKHLECVARRAGAPESAPRLESMRPKDCGAG